MAPPLSRLPSRLQSANLTYDELLRVAEDLLYEALPPARASVDALLSVRNPLPEWAVISVLVSTDLIPCLFASLERQDCAVACVCKAWRQGWADTAAQRRELRIGRQLGELNFVLRGDSVLAAHPSGEWLAITRSSDIRLVDPAMRTLKAIPTFKVTDVAVSDDFIYTTHTASPYIKSYNARPPFAPVWEYTSEEEGGIFRPCLGPNGMLYAIMFPSDYEDGGQDEVLAFDAGTLELRLRFGGDKFKGETYGMALVGEELYVGDRTAWSVHVFSLAGEHLRELFGDWREPKYLLHVNGRLYLSEQDDEIDEEAEYGEWSQERKEAGRRVFVLTLEGQTLQVWKAPGGADVRGMGVFQNELMVATGSSSSYAEPLLASTYLMSLAGI